MPTIVKQPSVTYTFYNLTQAEEVEIKDLVSKNIEIKADAYLKSIFTNNKDAVVKIDYKIQKNKKNRFEASFRFSFDGKIFIYKNKTAFKYTADLVNHAFIHFTRAVAEESNVSSSKRIAKKVKEQVLSTENLIKE
jgi:hypothetical protein